MLRYIILFFAGIALLTGCDVRKKDSLAEKPLNKVAEVPQDPTTVQIIDSLYNFGKVGEGDIVEFNYRFKNTGNKPLVVTQVSASCGCTIPEKPEEPIKPGEIGFIKVKFNSANRPGEARKSVTVTSNANPPFPTLQLRGEVIGKEHQEGE